jgi:hypothetical protein
LNWRERGSAGFGYASRRVGSRSLLRVARPCVTVVPGPGRIDCGQLPRSRLAIAEHSGELLSKSVRSESGVVAVEQAAQLLTPDTRIHSASRRVKLFSKRVSSVIATTWRFGGRFPEKLWRALFRNLRDLAALADCNNINSHLLAGSPHVIHRKQRSFPLMLWRSSRGRRRARIAQVTASPRLRG